MSCQDCIAQANEFLDETLDTLERARHQAHLERCPPCARYHRVLRDGLRLVRDVDEIQPSASFAGRLHGRLRGLEEEQAGRERAALTGASAVIAVAGLIALAAWAPILRERLGSAAGEGDVSGQGPVAEFPPALTPAWDWWYGGPAGESGVRLVSHTATFPGPYSPLVVQPPVTGPATRPASTYGE
jgi:anti-sigma factor RsiW